MNKIKNKNTAAVFDIAAVINITAALLFYAAYAVGTSVDKVII